MSYCNGAASASIEIRLNGQVKERILSKNPPVSWTCQAIPDQIINHNMIGAINYTFDYPVLDFSPISGNWEPDYINYPGVVISCPTTTTRPIYDFPPASKEDQSAETIKIQGNQVIGNFDLAGRYFDNRGTCVYRVKFGTNLVVSDSSGVIYSGAFPVCPDVLISCDEQCPSGYCKCKVLKFPGYCCCKCRK